MRSLQDGEGGAGVVAEDHLVGVAIRPRDRAQVDDGLHACQGAGDLVHIDQVDLRELECSFPRSGARRHLPTGWGGHVGAHHLVFVGLPLFDHRLATPAAGAGDQDAAAPHYEIDRSITCEALVSWRSTICRRCSWSCRQTAAAFPSCTDPGSAATSRSSSRMCLRAGTNCPSRSPITTRTCRPMTSQVIPRRAYNPFKCS